jgi:hypothetical protein
MRHHQTSKPPHQRVNPRYTRVPGGVRLPDESLARACGIPVTVEVEQDPDPERIDHVWIEIDCGSAGLLLGAVNTWSRRNAMAGFDPRVRLGLLRDPWEKLPAIGLFPSSGLDYAEKESRANIYYEVFEQRPLEQLLIEKAKASVVIEMWGQFYSRKRPGIHQIHSRRASSAVSEDLIGHDGALKFYFENLNTRTSETLLLKFCGQP